MPKKPVIYAIAGGPATGKTTFVASALDKGLLPTSAFVHDCDAVMVNLRGYQEQLAREQDPAKAWHDWQLIAREIAEQQLEEQISAKNDVIYDRSCALEGSYTFLQDLVNNRGYCLVLYVLHVPLGEAHSRALKRELTTQRHVPPEVITERHIMLSKLWPHYVQLATEAYVLDNSNPTATTIAVYKEGKLEVKNNMLYEQFISLGKEVKSHLQQACFT